MPSFQSGRNDRFRPLFFSLLLAAAALLSSCRQAGPPAVAIPPTADPPEITLSPNLRIGRVSWMGPGREVLVEIDPHITTLPRGHAVVRNEKLHPIAVLELGASAGKRLRFAQVLAGIAVPDAEVVAPGDRLRAWGEEAVAAD